MNAEAEVDWLQEMEEAREVREEEIASANLQGHGVSHITTLEGNKCLYAFTFPLSRSLDHPILLRTEHLAEVASHRNWDTGHQICRESRCRANMEPPPLNLSPKGEGEHPDITRPQQIQAPIKVVRLLESLRSKDLQRTTGHKWQDVGVCTAAPEGGHRPSRNGARAPTDPVDSHKRGSTVLVLSIRRP